MPRIGGRRRLVIVHVPSGYGGKTPVALILNLHGSGSTARQQELVSGMDATSDQDGFIVAYPQGLIVSGSGFDWNIPGVPLFGGTHPPKGAADDVRFLTQLVPTLAARYCIDPLRVFATGISGGGRMASQLACDASGTFAAVAPVAGLRFPSPCPTSRAVPVIAFHGTADPIDPYDGHGQAYWTYSVPTAAQRWGVHDACDPAAQSTSGTGYTLTAYGACGSGTSVDLYSLIGEGHEWPGGPPLPSRVTKVLGPQSNALDANTAMWAFFSAHPLP
jgi:polyhydroxybutyrate depolymerase